ncbi:MAG TPA: GntR family transcriptional regulator [Candidatus Dormibacteraeota bacterium]|nr:GntR family transcriptional regulator [Candidatus Dormibacteraeota bacterium]
MSFATANEHARASGEEARGGGLGPITVPRSRTDQVLRALTDAIVEGRLVPGTLHSVGSLAEQLGVSRTPVREALIQLSRRGMVGFERNRGVRILETTLHDLEEIFEIRLWIEPPATRQAVHRLGTPEAGIVREHFEAMHAAARQGRLAELWRHDRALHRTIVQCSGNLRAAQYLDGLRDLVLMRGATTVHRARSPLEIVEDHRPLVEAIEARDPERAAEEMRRHIRTTADLVLALERGERAGGARGRP